MLAGFGRGFVGKRAASFFCFFFLYLWHKTHSNIVVWCSINFFGAAVEATAKAVAKHKMRVILIEMHGESAPGGIIFNRSIILLWQSTSSSVNQIRIRAVLSTPIFLMLIIANVYFFLGESVGNIYNDRIVSDPRVAAAMTAVLYCGCQVALATNEDNKEDS